MVASPKTVSALIAGEGVQVEEKAQQLVPEVAMQPGEIGAITLGTVQHAPHTSMVRLPTEAESCRRGPPDPSRFERGLARRTLSAVSQGSSAFYRYPTEPIVYGTAQGLPPDDARGPLIA